MVHELFAKIILKVGRLLSNQHFILKNTSLKTYFGKRTMYGVHWMLTAASSCICKLLITACQLYQESLYFTRHFLLTAASSCMVKCLPTLPTYLCRWWLQFLRRNRWTTGASVLQMARKLFSKLFKGQKIKVFGIPRCREKDRFQNLKMEIFTNLISKNYVLVLNVKV